MTTSGSPPSTALIPVGVSFVVLGITRLGSRGLVVPLILLVVLTCTGAFAGIAAQAAGGPAGSDSAAVAAAVTVGAIVLLAGVGFWFSLSLRTFEQEFLRAVPKREGRKRT